MRRVALLLCAFAVSIVLVSVSVTSSVGAGRGTSFSTPAVIGFVGGDDWEPDVAADGRGNVYVAWAHYGGVPGCGACGSPAALIEVSHDGGETFGAPMALNPASVYQVDLQVAVNADGIVWVAYLSGKDTLVQRSEDFGVSWSSPVPANVDIKESWTDKVGLAVQGQDVYVTFSIAQRYYASSSHDGGTTFSPVQLNKRSKDTGWTLTSGGVVDASGNVYFSWVGIHKSGNALGPQEVFLTKSSDHGATWSFVAIAQDLPPRPDCSAYACGWDFWGPQMVVGVDTSNGVYVLYNAGVTDRGPPYVWFQASADGGKGWTPRKTVHTDGLSSAYHLFPAIEGGSKGQVHVSWMDNRMGAFNVYYRTSSDGGATFGAEVRVNRDLGYSYQSDAGFTFTYGDYYGMARDPKGHIHIAWAEAPDYIGPGNVWYAHA